jgi:hypothetical protein
VVELWMTGDLGGLADECQIGVRWRRNWRIGLGREDVEVCLKKAIGIRGKMTMGWFWMGI